MYLFSFRSPYLEGQFHLKPCGEKQSLSRLLRYVKCSCAFSSHFIFLKQQEEKNGNYNVKLFNKDRKDDDIKWFTKGQTENKKMQVGLSYSSQVYFSFIFCCNGDAPSKTTSCRRAHLFQPNGQPSMLRKHFDGNRVWQGAFLTRCFIYLKWFNCFDLIQT